MYMICIKYSVIIDFDQIRAQQVPLTILKGI